MSAIVVGDLRDALGSARPGDTLVLAAGIHHGPFQVRRGVSLLVDPRAAFDSVVLRGRRNGAVLKVSLPPGEELVIEGLRILNGLALEGGGVQILAGAATLRRCVIERNRAMHLGGGVSSRGATLVVEDCLFRGNLSLGGGGLYVGRGTQAEITGARFVGNRARCGGAVGLDGAQGTLRHCVLVGNAATLNGSAIAVRNGARLDIARSVVAGNWVRPAIEVEDAASSVDLGDCVMGSASLTRTRGLFGLRVGAPRRGGWR